MVRGLVVAIRFLTRISMPGRAVEPHELAPSVVWFPFVGALVGGTTAVVIVYGKPWLGDAAVVFGLAAAALLTGGLHEDGLADTCDGLGGGFTRERTLEIMRDSPIGSYGAIAIVLLYLARFALFVRFDRSLLFALPVAAALGQATTIVLMAWLPNARGEGVAFDAWRELRPWTVVAGIAIAIAIAFGLTPKIALPMLIAAALVTLLFGLYLRQRLGGITGDTLGALNVVAEVAAIATALVMR